MRKVKLMNKIKSIKGEYLTVQEALDFVHTLLGELDGLNGVETQLSLSKIGFDIDFIKCKKCLLTKEELVERINEMDDDDDHFYYKDIHYLIDEIKASLV